MDTIDLKREVEQAIQTQWPAFAARHPHLASALDQELLVEQVMTRLADEPEYRQAMERAAAVEWAAGSIQSWVHRFVGDLFQNLVG